MWLVTFLLLLDSLHKGETRAGGGGGGGAGVRAAGGEAGRPAVSGCPGTDLRAWPRWVTAGAGQGPQRGARGEPALGSPASRPPLPFGARP